jgi:hypothetical protein
MLCSRHGILFIAKPVTTKALVKQKPCCICQYPASPSPNRIRKRQANVKEGIPMSRAELETAAKDLLKRAIAIPEFRSICILDTGDAEQIIVFAGNPRDANWEFLRSSGKWLGFPVQIKKMNQPYTTTSADRK